MASITHVESATYPAASMMLKKPQMKREVGTRTMNLSAVASMAQVVKQHRSLTRLASRCIKRQSTSTMSQLKRQDSSNELDDVTIHKLCSDFAMLLSGDTEHTDKTGCLSNDSATSFDSFAGEEEEEVVVDNDFFDVSLIDTELQKEALAEFEEQQKQRTSQDAANLNGAQEQLLDAGLTNTQEDEYEELQLNDSLDLIEVSPGFNLPLTGSKGTWKAIRDGRITITKCCCCQEDLTCIDDADLVICCDCWVFSPVDQNSICDTPRGVGIGVKVDDMKEWIKTH